MVDDLKFHFSREVVPGSHAVKEDVWMDFIRRLSVKRRIRELQQKSDIVGLST
jgi:hypothetical protein